MLPTTTQAAQMPAIDWNDETLKRTFSKGVSKRTNQPTFATDEEWRMFVGLCQSTGLNPFAREIWCVPYEKDNGQRDTLIMVGIAGLRKIADRHPQFDGMTVEIEPSVADKHIPYRGTCTIWRKDRRIPIVVERFFHETKTSEYGRWKNAPFAQFDKCLRAACIREAFPDLSALYVPEEVPERDVTPLPESRAENFARNLAEASGRALPAALSGEELDMKLKAESEKLEKTEAEATAERSAFKMFVYDVAEVPADKAAAAQVLLKKADARQVEGTIFESPVAIKQLVNYEVKE